MQETCPTLYFLKLPARNTFVELVKVLLSCSSLALLKLSQGSYFDIGCFSLRFCSVLAPDHFKRKVKPLNTNLRAKEMSKIAQFDRNKIISLHQ